MHVWPSTSQAQRGTSSREDLDPATAKDYGRTLRRLCRSLGERRSLAELTGEQVARAFTTAWGQAANATCNRHRSTLRSFAAWADHDDPRPESRDARCRARLAIRSARTW